MFGEEVSKIKDAIKSIGTKVILAGNPAKVIKENNYWNIKRVPITENK